MERYTRAEPSLNTAFREETEIQEIDQETTKVSQVGLGKEVYAVGRWGGQIVVGLRGTGSRVISVLLMT